MVQKLRAFSTQKLSKLLLVCSFTFALVCTHVYPVTAFSNFMSAEIVIGQPNFTTSSSTVTQSSLNPDDVIIVNNKLIVADQQNNRVLIWNSVPTTSGAPADVVLGQVNFSGSVANVGGNSASGLNRPSAVASDGQRLLVADRNNNRILIWNSIPTTNFAPANVVIGQANFALVAANQGGTAGPNTLRLPDGLYVSNGKLFVSDTVNNRVLIFNSIPTGNNASANLVLGQPNFSAVTANNGGVSAISMSGPHGIVSDGTKLIVVEENNNRALIWNSIPTVNRQAADVVIGQANFSGDQQNQGGSATAQTLNIPAGQPSIMNGRLFIGDGLNNRVLIWNTIPTQNNAAADIVIGQPNFIATTENNGGISSKSLNFPTAAYAYNNKLYVIDVVNMRILVFPNVVDKPGLSLTNSPESQPNNQLKMQGTARVGSPYTVTSVQYAVNGNGFVNATATDGSFDENVDDFYFIFDPLANNPKDEFGNKIDGYTVQVRSTTSNADVTDRVFYFSPFVLNDPPNESVSTNAPPSFTFSVNKNRIALRDSLAKYQIQVRPKNSLEPWQTHIDNIPVDFRSVKGNLENQQRAAFENQNTNNGVYETDQLLATYSNESSTVEVAAKTSDLGGVYEWKAVAVDKAGHVQETGVWTVVIDSPYMSLRNDFPLAILNITGIGNPLLNSFTIARAKNYYTTASLNPTFYGIAWSNSVVTLQLTEQKCTANCTQTFTTTTNSDSRFGINVPKGALTRGKTYTAYLSASYDTQSSALRAFNLAIGSTSSTPVSSEMSITPASSPDSGAYHNLSPSPTPSAEMITSPENKRLCIWKWCW